MNLSIFPKIQPNESKIGYALRILKRHGFQSVSHSLTQPEIKRLVAGNPSKIANLDKHLPNGGLNTLYNLPFSQSLRLETPKVCPACIIENGYLKDEWQSASRSFCDAHGAELIDTCTVCDAALTWDFHLLSAKCPNPLCGKTLKARQSEHRLNELQTLDCIMAYFVCYSWQAAIGQNRNKLALQAPYQSLVKWGYNFLKGTEKYQRLSEHESDVLTPQLPLNFIKAKSHFLSSQLRCLWNDEPEENNQIIERLCHNNDEAPLLLNKTLLTHLLGITNEGVDRLLDSQIILTLNGRRNSSASLFNLAPLFSLLKTVHGNSTLLGKLDSILSQRITLLRNGADICDVLIAMKHGELNVVYHPSNCLLASLLVSPGDLDCWAKRILSEKQDTQISVQQATEILGISRSTLLSLKKKRVLKQPVYDQTGDYVMFDDVRRLAMDAERQISLFSDTN